MNERKPNVDLANDIEGGRLDEVKNRIDLALDRLKEVSQGRVFDVGTKIRYRGKFGVVTDLNQGSEDPEGKTIDIRLSDGTTVEGVSVTSAALEFFRA